MRVWVVAFVKDDGTIEGTIELRRLLKTRAEAVAAALEGHPSVEPVVVPLGEPVPPVRGVPLVLEIEALDA